MDTTILSTVPSSDIPQTTIERNDEGSSNGMIPRGGVEHLSSSVPPVPMPITDDGTGILSSEEVLRQAQERLKNAPLEVWGSYVRASTVTLLVGEASAGKTVLLYNLAYHSATGQEFLGLTANRPLRILSVDFEGNDEIRAINLGTIGAAAGWDIFVPTEELFNFAQDKRGPELIRRLERAIRLRRYDLVIVDSLIEAFPVEDENSNDDASLQMVAFRRLAQSTTAGIILVHNTGLKQASSKNKATKKGLCRGASSRVDRADIVLNYTDEGSDERALTVVKSRSSNLGEQIRVRFSGELGYKVIESTAVSQTTIEKHQTDSVLIVEQETRQERPEVSRKTIMDQLQIAEGSPTSQALDRALSRNVTRDLLHRKRKGVYSLPPTPERKSECPDSVSRSASLSEREAHSLLNEP
jgi:RecA/RadA recombinase